MSSGARNLHRPIGWLAALAAAATLGCPAAPGTGLPDPRPRPSGKRTAPASVASPSPTPAATPAATPTPAPVAVDATRRDALLASLRAAFPAGRASRVTALIGDASGA